MKSKGIAFGFDRHLEGIPFENLKGIDRIVKGIPLKSKGIAFGFDRHFTGIPFENLKEIDRIVKGIPFEI